MKRFETNEIVYDNVDFVFKYRNGTPIPAEKLFTQYSDPVMLIITGSFTFVQLGALGKSGKIAKDWIERKEIWRMLFKRDYPAIYARVTIPPNSSILDPEIQKDLDDISERPGNAKTYWKRYYELQQWKEDSKFKRNGYDFVFDFNQLAEQDFYDRQAAPQQARKSETGYGRYVQLFYPNDDDFSTLVFAIVTDRLDRFVSVIKIYWTGDSYHSKVINVGAGVRMNRLLNFKKITTKSWKSNSGWSLLYYVKTHGVLHIKRFPRQLLVSSQCTTCSTPSNRLFTCSNCKCDAYCGEECQLADWVNHKCQ